MTIYLEEEGELKLPVDTETLAREAAEAALDEVGCPYEAEVNLLLTMNGQIREMNREFRNIDRATDVLSFPMIEYETPGEFDFLEDRPDCFDPETGRLLLGDIVISKEKVLSQAEEYGHPVLSIDRPYNARSSGQLRTRMQAFVESLEIKRIQKRKQGGERTC